MISLREHLRAYFGDFVNEQSVRDAIFSALDANGDGQVTPLEFQQALAGGIHWPPGPSTHAAVKRRRRIFFHMDRDCSGELDLDEVMKALLGEIPTYGMDKKLKEMQALEADEIAGKERLSNLLSEYKSPASGGNKGVEELLEQQQQQATA
ncbi:unnamed protein product [Amoebophrya sp. A120]|nr:unnamed protein product [Amoebophrya sp. A120]|eukprot:GSA120T00022403001.1